VTLTIRVPDTVTKATSAYHGPLTARRAAGFFIVDIPALGYGDILRLE
jgi:hypothetical protein